MNIVGFPAQQPQISLFGVTEEQERQQAIMAHALAVVQSYGMLRESAMRLCISLYLCREQFEVSGEAGWESFCAANFHNLGLQQNHIRSAIRAGRGLAKYLAATQERQETPDLAQIESMSRSALILLGDAPEDVRSELISRVVEIGEEKGRSATAKEVQAEIDRLKVEKAEIERKLESKDASIVRLNNLVRQREGEIESIQSKIDDLQTQLSRQKAAVVVEDADPAAKRNREIRRNLEAEINDAKTELDKLQSDLGREKAQLERVSREAAIKKQAVDSIDALENSLRTLKAQWSESFVRKVTSADPGSYGPVFSRLANELRVLADQLDPALV